MVRAVCISAFLAAMLAPVGAIQGQTPPACRYDDCALRIDGDRVVAGLQGDPVGSLRSTEILERITFPLNTRPYLDDFERAVRAAKRWERAQIAFDWAGVGAGVFFLGSIPFGRAEQALEIAVPVGLLSSAGSLVMRQLSNGRVGRAESAFAQAVWWYNRDLPR